MFENLGTLFSFSRLVLKEIFLRIIHYIVGSLGEFPEKITLLHVKALICVLSKNLKVIRKL